MLLSQEYHGLYGLFRRARTEHEARTFTVALDPFARSFVRSFEGTATFQLRRDCEVSERVSEWEAGLGFNGAQMTITRVNSAQLLQIYY